MAYQAVDVGAAPNDGLGDPLRTAYQKINANFVEAYAWTVAGVVVSTNPSAATIKTALTLVKADVGLGNVDNTSDLAKPISTATQTALNLKADLASPALTGTPTAPTAAGGTNTTQIATCAFVFSGLALKADLASPTFTGTPAAPTAADGTNTTQIATTAYVVTRVSTYAEPLGAYSAINAQTGTTYTFVLTDKSKLCTFSNASAITVTIPANGSIAFPTNTRIDCAQLGAGQVTFAPDTGVTIRSSGSKLKLTGQYSGAGLTKIGTDEWLLVGDIST